MTAAAVAFPHVFSPLDVGTKTLKNRFVLTPHAHVVSTLWGGDTEAENHIAYWQARTDAAWIDGVSAHVRNRLIPGFDPTGIGAQVHGNFRPGYFAERVGELARTVHADGTLLTVQMILQGGMPGGPSAALSGPVVNLVPHPLTRGDIDYFIDEYAWSAGHAVVSGADGVELHLNHDDILEWFISPITNQRTDEFGGSFEGRLEFPGRILRAIRAAIGPEALLGIRFNLREDEAGGYDTAEGARIVAGLQARTDSAFDYVSCTIGTPWGFPSYVQAQYHSSRDFFGLTADLRAATSLPLVYTGRVTDPQQAEDIVAGGHADVVGLARAILADPQFIAKARADRPDDIRPCVGGNECLSRRIVENTLFSCAVNPIAARELVAGRTPATPARSVLVVGAGPAGLEFTHQAAERGHDVELWEASGEIGGQLRDFAAAPGHEEYARYLTWLRRRLDESGVRVEFGRRADAAALRDHPAGTIVLATGGRPRRPDVPGAGLPGVLTAADVLAGTAVTAAGPVVVIAQDDHLPPLTVADHLAEHGHQVLLVHGTAGPAPLISRYSLGSILGRLDAGGVTFLSSSALDSIAAVDGGLAVTVHHVYSQRVSTLDPVPTVVLACGALPNTDLADALDGDPRIHVLGDAWAPRRLVWATRQAYDLALSL